MLTAGLGIVSSGFGQNFNEHKISNSLSPYQMSELLNKSLKGKTMCVRYNERDYNFTAEQFLEYFMNLQISSVEGEKGYKEFLNFRSGQLDECKCDSAVEWIENKKTTMNTHPYSRIDGPTFNSGLYQMFNGVKTNYSYVSRQLEVPNESKINRFNKSNKGFKVILGLADYLSPENIRLEKNGKSTCNILVDGYEWVLLKRFIDNGMKGFLEQLPKK